MHNPSTAAAMFDLGASLRAARHKRGLELDAVQRELRIRKRYLEALESERFELLPGEVYARGFLREYAEFLGLDGSIYIDEYNAASRTTTSSRLPRCRRCRVCGAHRPRRSSSRCSPPWRSPSASPPGSSAEAAPRHRPRPGGARARCPQAPGRRAADPGRRSRGAGGHAAPRPDPAQGLARRLLGDRPRRLGRRTGPLREHGAAGTTVRLTTRRPFWMRVGAGTNLDAWVGGKALHGIPYMTGNLLVKA